MKINLAVFFGCISVEHEVSIISAVQAMGNVNKTENTKAKNSNHIGRNDLCPCGSGKKYKNCCMLKDNK